ncbi:MAG: CAP domain-containing protein, partial [Planctomycetota bacterium]
ASLPAQEEESRFLKAQAKRLNSYAKFALAQGFPRPAKLAFMEVIADYDKDDAVARKALGYLPIGQTWGPDPRFEFPSNDSPSPQAAIKVKSRWKSTARAIGAAHRSRAAMFAEAGRVDRAEYHYRRTLRFLPDDKVAMEGLKFKQFGGLSGTSLEQGLYERTKLMQKLIKRELKKKYPVTKLPADERHPVLEKSSIKYEGYKSEHFVIWGNVGAEVLKNAAMFAERSYAFCKEVLPEKDGFHPKNRWLNNYAFFKSKDDYRAIVDANADALGDRLEFTKKLFACVISAEGRKLQFGGAPGAVRFYDAAVRWTVWHYAGLRAPGVQEGTGHAVVGMFFDRNLLFLADMEKKQRTVSGKRDKRYLMPDLLAWKELAVEAAWRKDSVPAAKLPLFHASKFPNPARIKSWSLADYFLRRDPTLLQKLDRTRNAGHENAVKEEFKRLAGGLTLATLEQEWRDFWTGATPALKAINNNRPPMDAVSKDAAKWLEALNEARSQLRATIQPRKGQQRFVPPPIKWSASMSVRCKQHALYLKANRKARGPDHEQSEVEGAKGATQAGNLFAHMAIVSTKAKNPKKEIQRWMSWPGYRDAILNNLLERVGIYADGNFMVMHTLGGNRDNPQKVPLMTYPMGNQKAVPTEVPVKELGWDVRKLLKDNGHGKTKVVGFPLSMHMGGLGPYPDSFKCALATAQGDPVQGIVHTGPKGSHRRDSAPGIVVFYPLQPLKRGTLYNFTWTWDRKQGSGKERAQQKGRFTTR